MISLLLILAFQQLPGLSELISKAEAHWPNVQQTEYFREVALLKSQNIQTGKLPTISLNFDASYQSDVTEISLGVPGMAAPSQLKERLTLGLQANKLIYDGGVLNSQAHLESLQADYEAAQVQVGLVTVRNMVADLYFTALKLQKQRESLDLYQKDLTLRMGDVKSKVENGVVSKTGLLILQAQEVNVKQSVAETEQNRDKVISSLEILTGISLDASGTFALPELAVDSEEVVRPEFDAFSIGYKQLDAKEALTSAVQRPKVSSFLQTAYGRPGLDIFEDSFTPYYIVGVKASWNFWDWNKTKRERQIVHVQKSVLKSKEQTFRQQLQTTLTTTQQESEKWRSLTDMDDELIALKKEILEHYESQLANGIITSNEYLTELNAYHQALLTKEIHRIKQLEASVLLIIQRGAHL